MGVEEASDDEQLQPEQQDQVARHLRAFDNTEDAKKLRELQGDQDLLHRIMWAGYKGKEFRTFSLRLTRYGLTVIGSWCHSNVITQRCTEKGWALPAYRLSPDEAEELANVCVGIAMVSFLETVLIPQKWTPTGGASLETYFIGHCLMKFPNLFREHIRNKRRNSHLSTDREDNDIVPVETSAWGKPEQQANQRDEVRVALEKIPDATMRCILAGKAADLTHAQIAESCNVTKTIVDNRLSRFKKEQGVA